MNTFLRQNWFKIGLLIIVIAVAGGAFYWFEWRPAEIRSICYFALQTGGGPVDEKRADGLPSLKMKPVPSYMADQFYENCLRRYGLKN